MSMLAYISMSSIFSSAGTKFSAPMASRMLISPIHDKHEPVSLDTNPRLTVHVCFPRHKDPYDKNHLPWHISTSHGTKRLPLHISASIRNIRLSRPTLVFRDKYLPFVTHLSHQTTKNRYISECFDNDRT